MEYAITLLDFWMLSTNTEMIEIPQGTYLRKVDDRNDRDEYVSVDGKLTIDGYVVRKNKRHFTEVNEIEFKQNNVNIFEAVKVINKIIKDYSVTKEMVIDLLKKHYGIIDFKDFNYPYPGSINIPVIPYTQTNGCTMCGRIDGGVCTNTACPSRYNITFTT